MKFKKICVIGLGYIGLPTSAILAGKGFKVVGVDVSQRVVDTINQGNIHIVEPDLDAYVVDAVKSGNLIASVTPESADVFIIAVPTPFHEGYVPNINYVIEATKSIAPYVREGNIVILESTSPVGTTETVADVLTSCGVDIAKIHVAHCPERVLPGNIMKELIYNDRIVGGITSEATEKAAEFYSEFVKGEVLCTDSRTAEMAKLTENSFRDVNIAFANEVSMLCDKFGINVWELISLANRHPRVNILQPGCGVGGHCIAVDPWFIVHAGKETAKIIKTAREVNMFKTEWVIEKVKSTAYKFEFENGKKAKIACMGLAFKPNIDDLRESPALIITKRLVAEGFDIVAVEPNIHDCEGISLFSINDAVRDADILAFFVAHKEFFESSFDDRIVLDFCGVLK